MLKAEIIDKKISKAIIKAANEVISGKLKDHFPSKSLANWFWYTN